MKPEMNTLNVMLGTLNLVSNIPEESSNRIKCNLKENICNWMLYFRHWWQSRRARTVEEHP